MCPGVRLEGWLRWFAHHFVIFSAGKCAITCFTPSSYSLSALQNWQGVMYIYIYIYIGLEFALGLEFTPTEHAHSYF